MAAGKQIINEISNYAKIAIYESLIDYRYTVRRFGRKIEGKCIGTT